jgi:hypothetical protein
MEYLDQANFPQWTEEEVLAVFRVRDDSATQLGELLAREQTAT